MNGASLGLAAFFRGLLWILPCIAQVSSNSTTNTTILGAVGGGVGLVLVIGASAALLIIVLLCRRCTKARQRREQQPNPSSKALEVPSSLHTERSTVQQDSMHVEDASTMERTFQRREHSKPMPTTKAKLPTVSRVGSEQQLQSSSFAHVPKSARKRPGGYEWMFPARATLPRVTSTQGGPYPVVSSRSAQDTTSKNSKSLRRLRPSQPADACVPGSFDQLSDSDDEDYEHIEPMKTYKRQPPV